MAHPIEHELQERAGNACELCRATTSLAVLAVLPSSLASDVDGSAWVCATCRARIAGEAPLQEAHWLCLRESAWSAVPSVQAQSVVLLRRLDAAWARALADEIYLPDELQGFVDGAVAAAASGAGAGDDDAPTRDSNGTTLLDGDAVTLIKDLDVKGAGFTAKRGTLVKGIKLTGDPAHVEGRVNGTVIVLKTQFLKKA